MSMRLSDLFARMDLCTDRIPLSILDRWLRDLHVTMDEVREFAGFGDDTYRRNLVHAGPAGHVLLLCWRNGQRSPIHDHRGSNCGVRVLSGTATETLFDRAPNGMIVALRSRELAEGAITCSQDDDIHQVSNLQTGDRDLVTLHVYSPPLFLMRQYSLTDSRVIEYREPIHEFVLGGGI